MMRKKMIRGIIVVAHWIQELLAVRLPVAEVAGLRKR